MWKTLYLLETWILIETTWNEESLHLSLSWPIAMKQTRSLFPLLATTTRRKRGLVGLGLDIWFEMDVLCLNELKKSG